MRVGRLAPLSGIILYPKIEALWSFPAFELLAFNRYAAENQCGGILHWINHTTPQKSVLSQCEAAVSWNLAHEAYVICSARRLNSSRNASTSGVLRPRHSARMPPGGTPSSGSTRPFGKNFLFGTPAEKPMPRPLAT